MIKDKQLLARMADEDLRTPGHDAIMVWLHENVAEVMNGIYAQFNRSADMGPCPIFTSDDIHVTWEQPIRSGNIVGYVDMLAATKNNGKVSFEVKTSIKSIGETIRQINTYRTYLRDQIFCIVSPDDRFIKILKSQNILFVKAPPIGSGEGVSGFTQGGLF